MGCCVGRCIEIESPQSLLDYDNRDVFEEIIEDSEFEYSRKRLSLWSIYRNRGIPACDIDYWVQCMKDRYAIIKEAWDIKIKTWNEYYNRIDHDGVDLSDGTSDYTLTNEFEDMPDNPAGNTKYLSTRNTTTYTGSTHNDLESETVRRYIDAVPDPWEGFANEFQRYFWIGV